MNMTDSVILPLVEEARLLPKIEFADDAIPFFPAFDFFTLHTPAKFNNLQAPQGGGATVHAEFSHFGIRRLVDLASVTHDTLVLDIGSGRGSALILMQALTGCRIGGIEVQADLHQDSLELSSVFSDKFHIATEHPWLGDQRRLFLCEDLTRKPRVHAHTFWRHFYGSQPDKIVLLINNEEFHRNGLLVESIAEFVHSLTAQYFTNCPVTIFHSAALLYGRRHCWNSSQSWLHRVATTNKIYVSHEDKLARLELGKNPPSVLSAIDSFVAWEHRDWLYQTSIPSQPHKSIDI